MAKITYYSATEGYVSFEGALVKSGSGKVAGPEYGVLYRMADGRFLSGIRHTDRGDLMTHISIGEKSALPPALFG